MRATPLCPQTLRWLADNILELADVMDELPDTPVPITAANSVVCAIFDEQTDTELTAVSPVTLSQVGAENRWRESVYVDSSNGFSERQRLRLEFTFDGGVGLHGFFEAFAIVSSATE